MTEERARPGRRRMWMATLGALVLATTLGPGQVMAQDASPPADDYEVTIRRDGLGVPHVTGKDFASVAYGIGYAFAEDNICTVMDYTATISAERSKWFGPDATWQFGGNGTVNRNLDSDFFYAAQNESGRLEALLAEAPPHGPEPEVRSGVTGYAAGINRYLTDVGGADGITDPRCKGAPWVRPLNDLDVYRRFFQLATMASSGVAITGIAKAEPPAAGVIPVVPGVTEGLAAQVAASADEAATLAAQVEAVSQLPERLSTALGIGSNAYGLGREATDNGMGMVLGNPHFPWHGGERLYQMHLTIPGRANVSGAGLYGVPLVLIGHTDGVAWSHTVSTAYRFTPFELTLSPGDPTSYLVDGQPEPMTRQDLSVEVREPDGSIGTATRSLWSTRYGPMLNSLLGLPLFPWTPVKAYALGDANVQLRYLNQFFRWNQAQSTQELFDINSEHLGIPWVNTIAADRAGNTLYSDVSVVPHVTNEKATTCGGLLGAVTFTALGLPTLDGSRSECAWGSDEDAPVPGIFGPQHLPHLVRDDYVANGNDSYWLTNPEQPLEGFARIVGNERAVRSLRTRLGIDMVQQRLAGTDGHDPAAGNVFTQDILQDMVFENRHLGGELTVESVVALCRSLGVTAPTTSGTPVPIDGACDALTAWDRRDDLDSGGAVLFRRFWTRMSTSLLPIDVLGIALAQLPHEVVQLLPISTVRPDGVPWSVPFDVDDPVHTPRDLDTSNPRVAIALGDAIADLRNAGIPIDAGLRGWQYEVKVGEAIPVHGGPGGHGVFNAISARWNGSPGPRAGYSDIVHGSSFVMAAHFVDPDTNDGCGVDADAIVTYSQSEDVTRRHYADQSRLYAAKQWNPMYFCEAEIAADPGLEVTRLSGTDPTTVAGEGGLVAGSADDRLPATGSDSSAALAAAGAALVVILGARRWRSDRR